jgi:hypothetical protein
VNHSSKGISSKRMSWLSLTMCFTLLFSLLASIAAETVEAAKSNRLAVITEVGGTVTVQSAGGSKAYDAYTNMGLNQGDLLKTETDSYVVFKIKDTEDEMTIGSDSELYISELAKKGSGKTSKLKLWAGSMWSSVKKLVSDDDSLEIETPTAVMGVQGTQFYVYTNPFTGQTTMVVAAGVVRATTVTATEEDSTKKSIQESKTVLVYPAQQIDLNKRDEVKDLRVKVDVIDIEQLAKQAPPKVLETIIKNKADIDKENAEFIEKQKQALQQGKEKPIDSILNIKNQDDLNKVSKNLDHIIGNVAKQAIDEKKLEAKQVEKLAEEINRTITDPAKKLDLNKVEAMDKSAGVDPLMEKLKAEQLQALEAERLRQEQEALRQQRELEARLAAILKQAEEEKKRLDELNKKAAQVAAEKAEEAFLETLTQAEQQKFEENKTNNQNGNGSSTGTQTGSETGNGARTTNTPPTVELIVPITPNLPINQKVSLNVNAADSDGSISKVEFLVDDVKLSEVTSSPYIFDWTPSAVGNHTLKVTATDNSGATASAAKTVNVINNPPTAEWHPGNPTSITVHTSAALKATAADTDGSVKKVEFFWSVGSSQLNPIGTGTLANGIYSINWTPAILGSYKLTVRATDEHGAVHEAVTDVAVNSPESTIPEVSMSASHTSITVGEPIALSAQANDLQGIAKVEFWANHALISEAAYDVTSPFGFDWTPAAAGVYEVKAKAIDTAGDVNFSLPIKIQVNPLISLDAAPVSGDPGKVDLSVNIRNFKAKAVQLHFTTEGQQLMYSGAMPASSVFNQTGHYISGLNAYPNGSTSSPMVEYVFAALSAGGTVETTETEVFKIRAYANNANVKLAYVKIVLENGQALEIYPNQSKLLTAASS